MQSQIKLICDILQNIQTEKPKLYSDIFNIIFYRIQCLDFYDCFTALNLMNKLLNDMILTPKQTERYIHILINNLQYWRISQISMALLSKLSWRKTATLYYQCIDDYLSIIHNWCKQNDKYEQNNTNYKLYKYKPSFHNEKKKQLKAWVVEIGKKCELFICVEIWNQTPKQSYDDIRKSTNI